jgi:transposase
VLTRKRVHQRLADFERRVQEK